MCLPISLQHISNKARSLRLGVPICPVELETIEHEQLVGMLSSSSLWKSNSRWTSSSFVAGVAPAKKRHDDKRTKTKRLLIRLETLFMTSSPFRDSQRFLIEGKDDGQEEEKVRVRKHDSSSSLSPKFCNRGNVIRTEPLLSC